MNTLKISNINSKLSEMHDLEYATIGEVDLLRKKQMLYTPCNLNVVITPKCNAKCDFCIAKGIDDVRMISDDQYLEKLEEVLQKTEKLPLEATITGGEPTTAPYRLIQVLKLLKKYSIPFRTFSTNGSYLLERWDEKPLIQHLKDAGCVHNISISRMAIDDSENNRIFKNSIATDETIETIPTNKTIEKAMLFARLNDIDMRLNCNLLPGNVDSLEKILEYMSFYRKIGVESFIFRELVQDKGHRIDKIVNDLKKGNDCSVIKTISGHFYDVDFYKREDQLIKHYKQKYADKRILSNLVFLEGELKYGWD